MAQKSWHFDRRTFLKGVGVSVALPFLEAMGNDKTTSQIKRCCFFAIPNGVSLPPKNEVAYKDGWHWFPKNTGKNFAFPKPLEPFSDLREQLTILGGLSHPNSRKMHSHLSMDAFLTGVDASAQSYKNLTSVDQIAAYHFEKETRYRSLVFSCDGGVGSSGRRGTLSYDRNGSPIPSLNNPKEIFENLFTSTEKSKDIRKKAFSQKQKVVDLISENAAYMNRRLGKVDKEKFDEFLSALSSLENDVKRSQQWLDTAIKDFNADDIKIDVQAKHAPQDYYRTMLDLIALAFETDVTRTCTFMLNKENAVGIGDTLSQIALGIPGSHALSHDKTEKRYYTWGKLDQWMSSHVAYFLKKLSKIQEGEGSVLDNSIVMYGCTTSTSHNPSNNPILLAGGKNMGFKHGRYLQMENDPNLSNLYVTLLKQLKVPVKTFNDSDGEILELIA